jgi:poly(3-hydroxybutyrate) depolymerase
MFNHIFHENGNFFPEHFNYSYNLMELYRMQLFPFRFGLLEMQQFFENHHNPFYDTNSSKVTRATLEMFERLTRKYPKIGFNINSCQVDGISYKVKEKKVLNKPFCNLLHFEKIGLKDDLPKLLIVAPMSGHHATLLHGTVEDMLSYADVYITDWIDANQVPLELGKFDMDDFIDYIIQFVTFLGKNIHVMAVCQPTVPVLAAISIMSIEKHPCIPSSMILMGGPVDASKNPTKVNDFATGKTIEWFERMVLSHVPFNYPGYMRLVYPGFLQLLGFISMNLNRHLSSHIDLFTYLLVEDDIQADRQKRFYDEYFSVMDIPAEFYLQTIEEVFHNFSLARGTLVSNGHRIDLKAITKCALFGIEGENDDISAVGQTKESLNLCSGIPINMKKYHLQKGVGHYGVFSGSKFRKNIAPLIGEFIAQHQQA